MNTDVTSVFKWNHLLCPTLQNEVEYVLPVSRAEVELVPPTIRNQQSPYNTRNQQSPYNVIHAMIDSRSETTQSRRRQQTDHYSGLTLMLLQILLAFYGIFSSTRGYYHKLRPTRTSAYHHSQDLFAPFILFI